MKRKRKNEGEEVWKVWVLPLCRGCFFLAFGENLQIEVLFEIEWVRLCGVDCEQRVQIFEWPSEHEAFWDCFKRTVEMMELLGIEKVRSHVFPDVELSPTVLGYIDNLFRFKVVTSFTDLVCSRCLRRGHSAEVCYTMTDVDNNVIDSSSSRSSGSSSD